MLQAFICDYAIVATIEYPQILVFFDVGVRILGARIISGYIFPEIYDRMVVILIQIFADYAADIAR
jgi:hypothetical protein